MDRRNFIKALGVLAATPALAKYLNVFKSAPIREGIAETASMGMDFFNSVLKKVMDEGTQVGEADRISTFKHPDRADIVVEIDQGTGSATVLFEADSGTRSMIERVNTMDETTKGKNVSELFESEEIYGPLGREPAEGITGGIKNLEEFIKKRKFAMGGRVNLKAGGIPKALQAALKVIRSKFGDDAIKKGDEIESRSELFDDFQTRNPDPNRQMTADELEDFEMEIGGDNLEAYYFDGTVGDAKRILKEEADYKADMFMEYKKGKLDPVAGDKSPARKRFLEKKLEDAEMSGDKRLMTPDEIEELSSFDLGTQVFKDSEGGIKGITMGGDKEFKKAMSEAMEEGMRESENMKRLGLDPTKMDDAFKYDEMKEAGQMEKNVTGSADLSPVEDLKREFPGITDEMIESILTNTDPQRIAEVKQTMREAMEMEKKGMSVDEIISIFKNQKRTKQADGGIIGLTTNPRSANSKAGVETLSKGR